MVRLFLLFVILLFPLVSFADGERGLGDKGARVTVIEYASFTCPHCASFHNEVFPLLKEKYIDSGLVYYIYRDFPLDGTALGVSMLAECVEGDKYFAFLDLLYSRQHLWLRSDDIKGEVIKLSLFAGLSEDEIVICLEDRALYDGVMLDRQGGVDKFSVDSTPSLIIDGRKWSGGHDFASISDYLDELLRD